MGSPRTHGADAVLPKRHTLPELMADAAYFANELASRFEQLAKADSGPRTQLWQQAAKLARRTRSMARHEADEHRRRAKACR
jgi:hypothetical protein